MTMRFCIANAVRRARGFTLLETLVAITILAFAVAGPLFVADRVYVATQIARDNMVAAHLAQEGIEYVRRMRDYEYLVYYRAGGPTVSADAWRAFVAGTSAGSVTNCETQACQLDPFRGMGFGSGKALEACTTSCAALLLNSAGRYQFSSGTASPFTRSIQVHYGAGAPDRVQVESKVTWVDHGTPYTVTQTDYLTAWQ